MQAPSACEWFFTAYFYLSLLDSHVQGICEVAVEAGLGGGELSEQLDSSCFHSILRRQLSFTFPEKTLMENNSLGR